jgi:hypothetical protein
MPDQRRQPLNVLAAAVPQKAVTLAGTIGRRADADMVQIRQAEPMDGERAAADLARDFFEDVVLRSLLVEDGEDSDAIAVGTLTQANDARRCHDKPFSMGRWYPSIPPNRAPYVKPVAAPDLGGEGPPA